MYLHNKKVGKTIKSIKIFFFNFKVKIFKRFKFNNIIKKIKAIKPSLKGELKNQIRTAISDVKN